MKKIVTLVLISSSMALVARAEESKLKIEMPSQDRAVAQEQEQKTDIGGQARESLEYKKHLDYVKFIDRHYNK